MNIKLKTERIKTLKLKYAVIAIVAFCFLAVFFHYFQSITEEESMKENENSYSSNQSYSSSTSKEDCYICGSNTKSTLAEYWGEHNIGLINLNTLECCRFEINRYDDDLNVIEKQQRYASTRLTGLSESGGSTISCSLNSNRGYMSGTITLNENSFLEPEKVESYLCSECLMEIMKGYFDEEHWDIAVVDFFTKEVRPLNESVTAFFRNDYYVDCLYNKDRNTIMFQAFYCPERYSELDYDENESVLSQIESYCDEIGIRFSPNDEVMDFINQFNRITEIMTVKNNMSVTFKDYTGQTFKELIIYEDGSYEIFSFPE